MLSEACIALFLDGPMQSWGHASRFDRRTTALHPTRSGVFGLIAAALGIDKYLPDEIEKLSRLNSIRMTTVRLDRRDANARDLAVNLLEDYHTVTGIRRASGKADKEATVQTYRHYLLDARFGVLLEGPIVLLEELASALHDPKWGIWLGRKCCLPASPVLAAWPSDRDAAWKQLLICAGFTGAEVIGSFDHIFEVPATDPGADIIDDALKGYGQPIGERHAPRWIRRVPGSTPA